MNYSIRKGKAQDVPSAFRLIEELAVYEKAPHEVTNTPEKMLSEGFGTHPAYEFFVAEFDETGEIFGISLYYYRYSTWKGKCVYLEDLIVTEKHRGIGAGKALFEQTAKECLRQNLPLMTWQVLDWNTPSIEFYQRYGATFDGEWINCKLSLAQIKALK